MILGQPRTCPQTGLQNEPRYSEKLSEFGTVNWTPYLANNEWLYSKHDHIIDRCLRESDVTKQRLMLNLLLRQPFDKESIRTDFIDYCLERLADPDSSYAVRAQCIKLAYEQMRHWTELLGELRLSLDALSREPLSPGLRSARNQVMKKMSKD